MIKLESVLEVIEPQYGTAYAIGGRLVLTCKHLFEDKESNIILDIGSSCTLRKYVQGNGSPTSNYAPQEIEARIVWMSSRADIALLEISDENWNNSPTVSFGKLLAPTNRSWDSTSDIELRFIGHPLWCCPRDEKDNVLQATRRLCRGATKLANVTYNENYIEITVSETDSPSAIQVEEARKENKSPWSGVSGAPVFHKNCLIGIMRRHSVPDHEKSLAAEPIQEIFSNYEENREDWLKYLNKHGINHNLKEVLGLGKELVGGLENDFNRRLDQLQPLQQDLCLYLSVYRYPFGIQQAKQFYPQASEDDLLSLQKLQLIEPLAPHLDRSKEIRFTFSPIYQGIARNHLGNQVEFHKCAIKYHTSCLAKLSGQADYSQIGFSAQETEPKIIEGDESLIALIPYEEIFYHHCQIGEYQLAFTKFYEAGCDTYLEIQGFNNIRIYLYREVLEKWLESVQDFDPSQRYGIDFENLTSEQQLQLIELARMSNCLASAHLKLSSIEQSCMEARWAKNVFEQLHEKFCQNNEQTQPQGLINFIKSNLATSNLLLGEGYLHQSHENTEQILGEAYRLFKEVGDDLGQADCSMLQGDLCLAKARRSRKREDRLALLDESISHCKEAANKYKDKKDLKEEKSRSSIVESLCAWEDKSIFELRHFRILFEQLKRLEEIYENWQQTGNSFLAKRVPNLLRLANLSHAMHDLDGAVKAYQEYLRYFPHFEDLPERQREGIRELETQDEVRRKMVDIYIEKGDQLLCQQ
jgi:hypothetical protein